jgi:TPR repeat protein
VLTVAAFLACTPSREACEQRAVALLRADLAHPEAGDPLACACDAGSAEACTALGAWHLRQDAPQPALDAFRRACDGGDGVGCNHLGSGLVEQDPAAAHAAFARGCDAPRPSAPACTNAGNGAFAGRGAPQDFAAAAGWFERACARGDRPSCSQAADARDPAGAARRFRQACALGDPRECLNLAVVLRPGEPERARLLALSCEAGLALACSMPR